MRIPIRIRNREVIAEIDSGATVNFIKLSWAKEVGLPIRYMGRETLITFDGTRQTIPVYEAQVHLSIAGIQQNHEFRIIENATTDVVLGMQWLRKSNPQIDWQQRVVKIGQKNVKEPITGDGNHGNEEETAPPASTENESTTQRQPTNENENDDESGVDLPDYEKRKAETLEALPDPLKDLVDAFVQRK